MAQKQAAPALVMVALLLFAATTPTAYGQRRFLGGIVGTLSPVLGSVLGGAGGPILGGTLNPVLGPVLGGIGGPVSPVVGGPVSPVAGGAGGILGNALGLLNINGSVCCSPTGNCNATTPPLPGVGISVICTNLTGASVVVGQSTTGVDGFFFISIRNILTLIGNILNSLLNGEPLPCAVIVKVPLNNVVCPVLNATTTIIAGVPELLGNVLTPVVNATVPLYVSLTIGA